MRDSVFTTRRLALACAMQCVMALASAQQLGRLFTTPAERNELERVRHGGKPAGSQQRAAAGTADHIPGPVSISAGAGGSSESASDGPAAPASARAKTDQVIVVNGIVTRNGAGRSTTWIDAVPHDANARLEGGISLARGRDSRSVVLTLPSGRAVEVKAGQSVDTVTGKVGESLRTK